MLISLSSPGVIKQVSKRLKEDIDNYCVTTYDGGHRDHLGASLIGSECKRKLWYTFRWCYRETFDGRMQRLFNRGHREEERFLEWLRGIGCVVSDVTEDGKQHRISDVMGHFGGSLDGKGFLPKHYEIEEEILFEFKTNGTGKGFNNLVSCGMILKKEQHYAQTCVYGFKRNLRYCGYLNINKNDDSLHLEVVELNHNLGQQMIAKAEQIILSPTEPPRLSDNPTYFGCKYCKMADGCHFGKLPEKNCRSCAKVHPVENACWFCEQHNAIIPKEYIPVACEQYYPICGNV